MATRSALFQVGGLPGAPLNGPLAAAGQYELSYSGPRLSMRDKRIWEIAMRAAQKHGWLDSEFRLSLSMVIQNLGLKDKGAGALQSIAQSLDRLARADLSFTIKGFASGRGRLLGSARKDGSRTLISVSASFAQLAFTKDTCFEPVGMAHASVSTSLGHWLLDFAWASAEYKKGFDVKYLMALSGSGADTDGFMKHLRTALAEVSAAAPEVLPSYRIEEAGRDASQWRVFMARGPEVAAFKLPQKERSKGAGAAKERKGQKAGKKGGLAL